MIVKVHIPLRTTLGTQRVKNKIDNMKSTWPMQKLCLGDQRNLYSTDSHWGFALGVTQILGLALGVAQILALLDTNMLV